MVAYNDLTLVEIREWSYQNNLKKEEILEAAPTTLALVEPCALPEIFTKIITLTMSNIIEICLTVPKFLTYYQQH